MRIAEALAGQEQRVDGLIAAARKFQNALRQWKKACRTGHVASMEKAARDASRLVAETEQATGEAAQAWQFDVRAYLETDAWRHELAEECARAGLSTFPDNDVLIAPPVVVRAQPGLARLVLGKANWPSLHPAVTAAELKRLNERAATQAALQGFVNALYEGSKQVNPGGGVARLRDLYRLFSIAPGWKKENPEPSFARQIYALHRSDVRTATDGKRLEFEFPSGKVRERDIFTVMSDDGREIRYYGILFR